MAKKNSIYLTFLLIMFFVSFATATVLLNSPSNGYTTLTNNVNFNCFANVTDDSGIFNMSLYDNSSGTFEAVNTTTPLSYSTTWADGNDYYFVAQTIQSPTGWTAAGGTSHPGSGMGADNSSYAGVVPNNGSFYYRMDDIQQALGDDTLTRDFGENIGNSTLDFYYRHFSIGGLGTTQTVKFYNGASLLSSESLTAIQVWTHANFTIPDGTTKIEFFYDNPSSSITISMLLDGITIIQPEYVNKTFTKDITEDIIWNCEACDIFGNCEFSDSNRTLYIDKTLPQIDIESPSGTLDYNYVGGIEQLNTTFTDTNLDSCWYDYNGTNITIPSCVSGIKNSVNFILEYNNYNIIIYSNDTSGNLNSEFIEWDYSILEVNTTYNLKSYETETETFSVNAEGVSSAIMYYNGTAYTTTKSGNIFTRTITIEESQTGNKSIYWTFDGIQNSTTIYQDVSEIIFTLCNATYNTKFLNISFKDESNLSSINAAVYLSFDYYLGNGDAKKTLSYLNATENAYYAFCFSAVNETLNVVPTGNYESTGYQARNYEPGTISLTNSTKNETLYLLSSADGIYSTYVTVTSQNTQVEGTSITIIREISGNNVTVAQGTTDSSGSFTAWLNPNYYHYISASKTGVGSADVRIKPTQSSYTLVLTSTTNYSYISNIEGLLWGIFPFLGIINTSSSNNYGFNVSSELGNIVGCKIELLNNDKTITLSSAETIATNSSFCSVYTTYTINSTYPKIKGRLLVDIGDGYQILEEDALWVLLEVDTTGMTFSDWFGGLKEFDLRYFNNNEQHREYTMILVFFLFVMILCAILNVAGWDFQTQGGLILLVGALIWLASVPGFLRLSGVSPFGFIDQYFLALIYLFFMIGFGIRSLT